MTTATTCMSVGASDVFSMFITMEPASRLIIHLYTQNPVKSHAVVARLVNVQ